MLFEIASKLLERASQQLVWDDKGNCFFPGGTNGPHLALESPVRNSAHILTALISHIEQSDINSSTYEKMAMGIMNWFKWEGNPFRIERTFWVRQKSGVDVVNGVIGPAWVAEGIFRAGSYFKDEQAINLAKDIINAHQFDSNVGLWKRYDPLSKIYRFDLTYDHQVIFASIAVKMGFVNDVDMFLNKSSGKLLGINQYGRYSHLANVNSARGIAAKLVYLLKHKRHFETIENIENCYHHYNLFGFATIHKYLPEHSFFRTDKFARSLSFLNEFDINKIRHEKLGFLYNNPIYEFPLIVKQFGSIVNLDKGTSFLGNSYKDVLGECLDLVDRSCDKLTQLTRVYELFLGLEN